MTDRVIFFVKQHHPSSACHHDSMPRGRTMTRHVTFMTIDDAGHYTLRRDHRGCQVTIRN
ncbi:hypothetical protein NKH49_20970 [Mesorhizobium sp. M1088]|uniref:hypothetical protein n=1 Tax=Mesorhizobium sp. M1088 TaxID=2957056 RepID=UPI003337199A